MRSLINKEGILPTLGMVGFGNIWLITAILQATELNSITIRVMALFSIAASCYLLAYGILTRDRPFSKRPSHQASR